MVGVILGRVGVACYFFSYRFHLALSSLLLFLEFY